MCFQSVHIDIFEAWFADSVYIFVSIFSAVLEADIAHCNLYKVLAVSNMTAMMAFKHFKRRRAGLCRELRSLFPALEEEVARWLYQNKLGNAIHPTHLQKHLILWVFIKAGAINGIIIPIIPCCPNAKWVFYFAVVTVFLYQIVWWNKPVLYAAKYVNDYQIAIL